MQKNFVSTCCPIDIRTENNNLKMIFALTLIHFPFLKS